MREKYEMSEDFSEKEKSKASEESERVPSREQEKYRCMRFQSLVHLSALAILICIVS
jgi:hypothetical protein